MTGTQYVGRWYYHRTPCPRPALSWHQTLTEDWARWGHAPVESEEPPPRPDFLQPPMAATTAGTWAEAGVCCTTVCMPPVMSTNDSLLCVYEGFYSHSGYLWGVVYLIPFQFRNVWVVFSCWLAMLCEGPWLWWSPPHADCNLFVKTSGRQ